MTDVATPVKNSPDELSRFLRERYMINARDQQVSDALSEILEVDVNGTPTGEPVRFGLNGEARGLLVLGASGEGKTVLLRRNLTKLWAVGPPDDWGARSLLHLTVPAEATLKSVAARILHATGYPAVKDSVRTAEVWDMAVHRLAKLGVRSLWIDEAHHLLRRASGRDVPMVLQRLKTLMQGENAVALILSGVPELDEVVRTDPETSRRFYRMTLTPMSDPAEKKKLEKYVALCCKTAGLQPLQDPYFPERLLAASRGSLGCSIELTLVAIRRTLRERDDSLSLRTYREALRLQSGHDELGPFADEPWPSLRKRLEKKGWAL